MMFAAMRNTLVRWFRAPGPAAAMVAALTAALVLGGALTWGYWNPEDRTSQVPAAVVNEDSPTQSGQTSVGDTITAQVLQSDSLAWEQTDINQAREGLQSGRYFAVLRLPADLSRKVASLDTDTPQQAQIELTTNDATNYFVSEDAARVVDELDGALNQGITLNFLNQVYDALPEARAQGQAAVSGAEQVSQTASAVATAAQQSSGTASSTSTGADGTATSANETDTAVRGLVSPAQTVATGARDISTSATAISASVKAIDANLAAIENDLTAKGDTAGAAAVAATRQSLTTTVQQPVDALVTQSTTLASQSSTLATNAQSAATRADATKTSAQSVKNSAAQSAQQAASVNSTANSQLVPQAQQLAADLSGAASKVAPVSDEQRQAFSEVLAEPVSVSFVRDNQVQHLGQGLAAYFLPVALFGGALVTFLLMRPINQRLLQFGAPGWRAALSSWLPSLAWGLLQVALLLAGMAILGLAASAWLPLAGVLAVSVACFLAIVQLLKVAFGGVGTYLGLALLIVQLVTVAGVFPIQTSSALFRFISPAMPMTYSVDAVRRTVAGGPLSPYVWQDVAILAAFAVVALVITVSIAQRRRRMTLNTLDPAVALA